jgi:hypothetical protein
LSYEKTCVRYLKDTFKRYSDDHHRFTYEEEGTKGKGMLKDERRNGNN